MGINEKIQLTNFIKIMRVFRIADVDATLISFETFIRITLKDGIGVYELVRITGTNRGTMSRILAILSEFGRGTKHGLGLIKIIEDPSDRRYKNVFLTKKGQAFAGSISAATNAQHDKETSLA